MRPPSADLGGKHPKGSPGLWGSGRCLPNTWGTRDREGWGCAHVLGEAFWAAGSRLSWLSPSPRPPASRPNSSQPAAASVHLPPPLALFPGGGVTSLPPAFWV